MPTAKYVALFKNVAHLALILHLFSASYRVASDRQLARRLHDLLSATTLEDTGQKLRVYLDQTRLEDGQRWDSGFMEGLAHSWVFVPIVSVGSVAPMCNLGGSGDDGDWTDNVSEQHSLLFGGAVLSWQCAFHLSEFVRRLVCCRCSSSGLRRLSSTSGGGSRRCYRVSWQRQPLAPPCLQSTLIRAERNPWCAVLVGESDFFADAHAAFGGVQALPNRPSAATMDKVVMHLRQTTGDDSLVELHELLRQCAGAPEPTIQGLLSALLRFQGASLCCIVMISCWLTPSWC